MWTWVVANNGLLALIVAAAVAIATLVQYISIKRSEESARIFSNFHQLLQDLNEGKERANGAAGAQYIDRQVAIMFELREFVKYYPVILRILKRSIKTWGGSGNPWAGELVEEAKKTIAFIKRKQHRRFWRCIDLEESSEL